MKCKLGTIVDITMGQSPKSEYYNTKGEGYPFLQGNRTFGVKYPTFDTFTTMKTKLAQAGDVIMSVRAPVGDLNITPVDMCLGRGVCSLRMKNGNQNFLFYLMKHYVPRLLKKESGTIFGSVNKTDIASLEVDIPEDSETQSDIARYLEMLDDKIELNNKINANLEQQAQALFKAWFVDFEPFGGKMPEDWRRGRLSEIASISAGKRPSMRQELPTSEVNIPLIGAASIMGYTNTVLYNEPILVTGRVGTHGVVQRFRTSCWASDNTLVIKSKFYEYVYLALQRVDYSNMNRGTTQPLITQTDLKNVQIVIPSEAVMSQFEENAGVLMALCSANCSVNVKLGQIRDGLLPKLMSGKVFV